MNHPPPSRRERISVYASRIGDMLSRMFALTLTAAIGGMYVTAHARLYMSAEDAAFAAIGVAATGAAMLETMHERDEPQAILHALRFFGMIIMLFIAEITFFGIGID